MAIFVLLISIAAYSMDLPMAEVVKKRPASEAIEQVPAAKEERIELLPRTSTLQGLPEEIQERIRSLLNTAPGFGIEKLYNVAKNIRALRLVSKEDRDKVDDPEFVESLIQFLANQYTNGNKTKVVLALHTKSAADWLNKALDKESRKHYIELRRLSKEVTNEIIEQLNQGHVDAARFLLNASKIPHLNQYFVYFGYVTPRGETVLQAAAKAGDLPFFKRVIGYNTLPLINQINDDGQTALSLAITFNHTPIALALLRLGANTFISDESGQLSETALLLASYHNNTEVIKELLENPLINLQVKQKANFNNDFYPFTPLYYAVEHNNYPIFSLLLHENAELDGDLLYKALIRNTQMVVDLIKKGIDVNQQSTEDFRDVPAAFGVFYTSESGYPEVSDDDARARLMLLLNSKLNVNSANEKGVTLLMRAVEQAKAKTVEALLYEGADVNLSDNKGHNALWYAQQLISYNKDHIIKMLQDAAIRQEQEKKKKEERIPSTQMEKQ